MPPSDSSILDQNITDGRSLRTTHDEDLTILDSFEPEVVEWWLSEFGLNIPLTGGLLTPPQRESFPSIRNGTHTIIAAPTGSGKCVTPETPLHFVHDGEYRIETAAQALHTADYTIAKTTTGGVLSRTDIEAISYNSADDLFSLRGAFLYQEDHDGILYTIETSVGDRVRCTPEHPLLVKTTNESNWLSAQDIAVGDEIAVARQPNLTETTIPSPVQSTVQSLNDAGYPASIITEPGSDAPVYVECGTTERSLVAEIELSADQMWIVRIGRVSDAHIELVIPQTMNEELGSIAGTLLQSTRSPSTTEFSRHDATESAFFNAIATSTLVPHEQNETIKHIQNNPALGTTLIAFFASLFGVTHSSGERTVPTWMLNAPRAVKSAIATAAFGHHAEVGDVIHGPSFIEEVDAERFRCLCRSAGYQPVIRRKSSTNIRVDCIPERSSSSDHDQSNSDYHNKHDPHQSLRWVQISAISKQPYQGSVIDLSVPGPANYVGGTGGIVLHNTLAAFSVLINDLIRRAKAGKLENSVYCLYISPMKSLVNDVQRNLSEPLNSIQTRLDRDTLDQEIRHATRHGDTSSYDRRRMLDETPHILNTTPETVAILLNSPKFRELLRTVEYLIVDEVHSLADNKRGSHLAVSLERITHLANSTPIRIGCSATIEPLESLAEFLVGSETEADTARPHHIADARFSRQIDVELISPAPNLAAVPKWQLQDLFYDILHDLIQQYSNTLVFTNTRSGAERILYQLRERYPTIYTSDNSGCHHGSLSEGRRVHVESGLKDGIFDVVTTSTSLELGIDMPHLDLVIQIGSPKSVAALLQRIGRAGHQLGKTVTGRVIALEPDDLIECTVMLDLAITGQIDRVSIPAEPHDVAIQHIFGMSINAVKAEREVWEILTQAYPYWTYTEDQWESVLRYLTAEYPGLAEQNFYPKIWRDLNDAPDGEHHYDEFPVGESLIGSRGRLARPIYLTNVGTIPDSFTCHVFLRDSEEWVGDLDEAYLDTLDPGDVFILGGSNYKFRYRRGAKVYADHTSDRPTVPTWFSERLPLTHDVGVAIADFQADLIAKYRAGGPAVIREWLRTYPIDENAVRSIARLYSDQLKSFGPTGLATQHRLPIEEEIDRDRFKRRYYIHSLFGRRFNDGFARLLASLAAESAVVDVTFAVADSGFTLVLPMNQKIDIVSIIESINPDNIQATIIRSLHDTDLLQRYFRMNATRSFLILKRYKGYEKSVGEQQFSSEMLLSYASELDDFPVMEETYREILYDKFDLPTLNRYIKRIHAGEIEICHHHVEQPSPRAQGLASLSTSDSVISPTNSSTESSLER